MCDPVTATMIAIGASAGGTALQMNAAAKQDRARKQAALQGLEDQAAIQDKANARTDQYVQDTYDPTKRMANYEAEANKTEKSLGELLAAQAASGQGAITDSTTGAVSDAYTQQKARSTADAADRSRTLSRLLARGGAGANLFGSESLKGADYSSDMMGYGVDSRLANNRARVRADAANSAGSGMALLGGLLSTAGTAVGGMGGKAMPNTTDYRGTILPTVLRGGG